MSHTQPTSSDILSDDLYNLLKPIVTIFLPGLGTLYFALSQIWGLPAGEQVVGTIAAITTFLGSLIGYSSRTYHKRGHGFDGAISVEHTEEGKKLYSLNLSPEDLEKLDQKSQVTFKIQGSQ